MSGEMPIHAAALHRAPQDVVEIYYDPVYYLNEYARAAVTEGLASDLDYARFLGERNLPGPDAPRSETVHRFARQGLAKAEQLRDGLISLGINPQRIRIVYADDVNTVKGRAVSETHKLIADHYHTDETTVRDQLRHAVLDRIPQPRREHIDQRIRSLGLTDGQPTMLLWVRRSGLEPGGAYPELDMPDQFLEQIADSYLREHPHGRVLLIGDEPGTGLRQRRPDLFTQPNLIKFWSEHTLTPGDRAEQMYFLDQLRQDGARPLVAVGMESGAIELPALLGIDTVYLERRAMRGGKDERWTYVAGARYGDAPDGPAQPQAGTVSTWRRQQFEAPTEWLFAHARLARIANRLTADPTVTQQREHVQALRAALDDWRQTVLDYHERLTASADDAPDWMTRSSILADQLLTAILALDPENTPEHLPEPLTRTVLAHQIRYAHTLITQLDPTDTVQLTDRELDRLFAQATAMRHHATATAQGQPPARMSRQETQNAGTRDKDQEHTDGVPLGTHTWHERDIRLITAERLEPVEQTRERLTEEARHAQALIDRADRMIREVTQKPTDNPKATAGRKTGIDRLVQEIDRVRDRFEQVLAEVDATRAQWPDTTPPRPTTVLAPGRTYQLFADAEETLDALQHTLDTLQHTLDTLQAELQALLAQLNRTPDQQP